MYYPLNTPEAGGVAVQEFYSDTYPKAAYRDAEPADLSWLPEEKKERLAELDRLDRNRIQGRDLDFRMLKSAADEAEALAGGWRLTVAVPGDVAPVKRGPGRPRLEA